MASEQAFKRSNRPSGCTKRPWEHLVPPEKRAAVIAQIKEECLEIYGHDFTQCSKRFVCLGKTCLGRELEWKSPTALPYLKQWALTIGLKEGNDYFIQTDCGSCPIARNCTSTCSQINDFINRNKTAEPELIYKETLDNVVVDPFLNTTNPFSKVAKIPWDSIDKVRQKVIKKYLYEKQDFLTISKELSITDSSQVKYLFYSGLTTLSEYGIFREFLEKKGDSLTKPQSDVLKMVYVANLNIVQVAKVTGKSKQSIQQLIARVIKKNGIQWTKFVQKKKNKLIYKELSLFQ